MKNTNTIRENLTANREAWFAHRHQIESNVATLEAVYRATLDQSNRPAQAVVDYVEAVGYAAALEIIGSLINAASWDGRIYPSVKRWAQALDEAWDEEAARNIGIYTTIHRAHLNQIAQALMAYQPAAQTIAAD